MTITVVLASVAVAGWLVTRFMKGARQNERHKRDPFAACDGCGYDLTGSQGVCAECGRVQAFHTCQGCGRRVFRPPGACPFCQG